MTSKATIAYDEVIETNGVKVPFVSGIITPAIEKPMRNNRYEGGECNALRELLEPGDRVLELGAGVGLLSTVAATVEGVEVVAVEANPDLIPLIRETHRLNGVESVTLLNGVVAPRAGDPLDFYLRADFWASSMEPDSRPFVRSVKVPSLGIGDLIAEHDPTVIVCDIEGGELGLFDRVDLSNVRLVVMEFHPKVYGRRRVDALHELFARRGLDVMPVEKPTSVRRFLREATPQKTGAWPPRHPRFLVSTCMKDEGPFILEWIAWHRSIGIEDFIVFTNDCSDGTDLILERLEQMGYLRHLPNPALATGSTYFQPAALSYTPHLPEWRHADFYISMDVDEFINVRVGTGSMADLLNATGFFDALSMSELNHGSNNRLVFEPGLMTEQFPRHQSESPAPRKALRGVKTIVRISEKLDKPRNHRPDFHPDRGPITWLDGSARPIDTLLDDPALNGIDVRGSEQAVGQFLLRGGVGAAEDQGDHGRGNHDEQRIKRAHRDDALLLLAREGQRDDRDGQRAVLDAGLQRHGARVARVQPQDAREGVADGDAENAQHDGGEIGGGRRRQQELPVPRHP
jgi:FkbM family methyltransferase